MTEPRGLPSVGAVVDAFVRSLQEGSWPEPDGVMGVLLELHRNNLAQWHCEDVTRAAYDDDAVVAAAKRDIDRLNANRHRLVEEIDAVYAHAIAPSSAAPLVTEAPAMVFDRLSVAAIRLHETRSVASEHAGLAARVPLLEAQLADLASALRALLADAVAGRRSFAPYRSLKLYGEPD